MPALVRLRFPAREIIRGRDRLRPRTLGEIMDEANPAWRRTLWEYQEFDLNGRLMPDPLKENKRSRKRAVQKMDQRDAVGKQLDRLARQHDGGVEEDVWRLFE